MNRPRVLLADDHTMILAGLRSLLESDFDLVGTVEDGRALLDAAVQLKPDIIMVDISMPLLNGIEAARQLKKLVPQSKIIFLTMHGDVAYVKEAFRVGASGYLIKRSAASELVTAIQEVLKGRTYVTPLVTKDMMESFIEPTDSPEKLHSRLTPRQREVLQLVAEGHSNKEIASVLKVSTKTVEFHKYNLMQALGIRTTAELTQYAMRHGYIST
ncbi:MAG: response regulator transcription factor [Acidobacteriia bacterium]|nr:response regulator transcription factor [Terriglobia bacterium]